MKTSERKRIEAVIRMLMADEGDFHKAVGELCALVGWEYPAAHVKAEAADITELSRGPNSTFQYRPQGGHDGR